MTLEKERSMAKTIAERVLARGGRTYFVGGCVRDEVLGLENNDIDLEIHGISAKALENILSSLGTLLTFGESFCVYNLKGYSLDISLPQKEKAGTEASARRRDLTCNALMRDVISGEIIGHFGGIADLKAGILRHVDDETFAEDPLRVLRTAGFAARFGFSVAPETMALCRSLDLENISKERVEGELKKVLLQAPRPSVFFEVLREADQLDLWFPELKALIGVEQNPRFHTEGDVWCHTMLVIDEAVRYRDKVGEPFGFMLSALVHDFGKAICTAVVKGELHSYGHEREGLPLAEGFLKRITNEKSLCRYVLNMTELHMRPNFIAAAGASVKSTNKMFDLSADPEGLLFLAFADGFGTISPKPYVPNETFLYERLAVFREYMARPYVRGKDLIEAGLTPDADFSAYLEYAHKLRLAGIEKNSALKQTLAFARKYREKKNGS